MVGALDTDPRISAQGRESPLALELPSDALQRLLPRKAVEHRPALCDLASAELEQLLDVLRELREHTYHQPLDAGEVFEHARKWRRGFDKV